jgi:hypothetical protein
VNARLADALEGVDLELGLLVGGGRRWRSQAGVPHAGSVAEPLAGLVVRR